MRKIREEGSMQTEPRGPKELGLRGPSFGPPTSVCLLPSLRGLPPSKKMIPENLQLIMTSPGYLQR